MALGNAIYIRLKLLIYAQRDQALIRFDRGNLSKMMLLPKLGIDITGEDAFEHSTLCIGNVEGSLFPFVGHACRIQEPEQISSANPEPLHGLSPYLCSSELNSRFKPFVKLSGDTRATPTSSWPSKYP